MESLPGLDSDLVSEIVRILVFVGFIAFAARRQLRAARKIFRPKIETTPALVTCFNCGQLNSPQATTCKHCGLSLRLASGTVENKGDDRSVPPLVKKV